MNEPMSDAAFLQDAFRLCNIYHRRYKDYPTSIGVSAAHTALLSMSIETSSVREPAQTVTFHLDPNATPEKVFLHSSVRGAVSSSYLNALRFVPLSMLSPSMQKALTREGR